jgi:hypothetical protein
MPGIDLTDKFSMKGDPLTIKGILGIIGIVLAVVRQSNEGQEGSRFWCQSGPFQH